MDYFRKVFFHQTLNSLSIEDKNEETTIYYEINSNKIEICAIKEYRVTKNFKDIFWCKRLIIPEIVKILGLKRLEIFVVKITNINIKCNLDLTYFKNLRDLILLKTKINGNIIYSFPKKKINLLSIKNKQVLNYQLSIFLKNKIKNFNIEKSKICEDDVIELKSMLSNKTLLSIKT